MAVREAIGKQFNRHGQHSKNLSTNYHKFPSLEYTKTSGASGRTSQKGVRPLDRCGVFYSRADFDVHFICKKVEIEFYPHPQP